MRGDECEEQRPGESSERNSLRHVPVELDADVEPGGGWTAGSRRALRDDENQYN